ncbi:MAG: protein phosphatase 2C domain-containing protein [Proteobacteria bacterium]|nr:protein phosphatase 2C domain-containing protein [Pseudomonadota bacterium]
MSDPGLVREVNEDSFSVEDSLGLYVVADGMGGHLAGDVASAMAVELINKSFRRWTNGETPEDELFGHPDESLSRQGNYVLSSIRLANKVIYEMALEYDQYHGMGTTVVVLRVTPNRIITANVGDSRVYMVRDGRIERLSKDHTVVSEQVEMGAMNPEQAAKSPIKHILTRNLGSAEKVDAEIYELEPLLGDRFILCTDGLTELLDDEEILQLTQKEDHPESLCRELVALALTRGAPDNTTVVCVFLSGHERGAGGPFTRIKSILGDYFMGLRRIINKFKA